MKAIIAKFYFACRRSLAALNGNASRALLASLLLFAPLFGRADVSQTSFDQLNSKVDSLYDIIENELIWYQVEEIRATTDAIYAQLTGNYILHFNRFYNSIVSLSNSLGQIKSKFDSWDNVKDVSIPTLLNDLNSCKMDVNNIFNLLNNNVGGVTNEIINVKREIAFWLEMNVDTLRDGNTELIEIKRKVSDLQYYLESIYDHLGFLNNEFVAFRTDFYGYTLNVEESLQEIINLLNGDGHINIDVSTDSIEAIIDSLDAFLSGYGPIDVNITGDDFSLDDLIDYVKKIYNRIDTHFKLQTPFFTLFNASSNIYFKGYAYLSGPKYSSTKTSLSFADFTPQNVGASTITFFDSVKRLYEMEVDYYQSFETLLHNIQFSLSPTNAPDISTAKSKIEGASDSVDSVSSSLDFDLPSFTKTFPTANPFSPLQSGFSLPQNLTFDLAPNGVFGFEFPPVVINVQSVASYLSPIRYVCLTIYWGLSLLLFLLLVRWSVRGVVYLVGHVKDFKF